MQFRLVRLLLCRCLAPPLGPLRFAAPPLSLSSSASLACARHDRDSVHPLCCSARVSPYRPAAGEAAGGKSAMSGRGTAAESVETSHAPHVHGKGVCAEEPAGHNHESTTIPYHPPELDTWMRLLRPTACGRTPPLAQSARTCVSANGDRMSAPARRRTST